MPCQRVDAMTKPDPSKRRSRIVHLGVTCSLGKFVTFRRDRSDEARLRMRFEILNRTVLMASTPGILRG